MAGMKLAAYEGYLAKWHAENPNVVQPERHGIQDFEKAAELAKLARKTGKDLRTVCCKGWGNVSGDGVYELPDGRIVEVGLTTSGRGTIVAVFPDAKTRNAYDEPMSFRAYHEEW